MSTVPDKSRRQFLLVGGVTTLGAATLAACGGPSVVHTSGTIPVTEAPPTAPPTTADPEALEAERSILRTATSLEISLGKFYDTFGSAAYLDADAKAWGDRFGDHHRSNARELGILTSEAGGEAYTDPNSYVDENLIAPRLALADEAESADQLIDLAASLEATGAATDTLAVSSIVTPDLRAGIMAVGATNSRQAYLWRLMGDRDNPAAALPDALLSLRDALPAAASVDTAEDDKTDDETDDEADDKDD